MNSTKSLVIKEPVCIAASGDACGEGILWEASSDSIYWTDINRFLVHRYRLKDASLKTWFFEEPVTCVMETSRPDTLVLTMGSGVALWKPESDERSELMFRLPGWPFVRCNDAGIDPRGELWAGSMRNNVGRDGAPSEAGGADGALYRIDGRGNATLERKEVGIANTLVWTADRSRFYFGDSLQNCIWVYEREMNDGSLGGARTFFEGFERGLPDGSAIDVDGCVWNCRYGGSCIVRIAPSGEVDRVIDLPVENPTNCTFGGKDGTILFVTSARPAKERWERFGGCLFAIETSVIGVGANRFELP
jgi:sugar lactone lactonase YvrE